MSLSIGFLVAEALALSVKEFGKTIVSEATKDSYHRLKGLLYKLIGEEDVSAALIVQSNVETRNALATRIDRLDAADKDRVRLLLDELVEGIERENIPRAVGQRIHEIKTETARIKRLNVKGTGIGQQIDHLETKTFEIEELNVGDEISGKS